MLLWRYVGNAVKICKQLTLSKRVYSRSSRWVWNIQLKELKSSSEASQKQNFYLCIAVPAQAQESQPSWRLAYGFPMGLAAPATE